MIAILSDRIEAPPGPMVLLARDGVLICLEFDDRPERIARELKPRFGDCDVVQSDNPFGFTQRVRAYFAGDLSAIDDIPTDGGGTDFQRRVWAELKRIPCGAAISYGELARRLGDSKATRAVGLANGRNPIAIVVPCHRVIGADGSLTGYGGGMARKKWLLAHEGVRMSGDRITPQGDLFSAAPALS
jgi:methylated-DNA-[protein]-cysteine S-methyltransferase